MRSLLEHHLLALLGVSCAISAIGAPQTEPGRAQSSKIIPANSVEIIGKIIPVRGSTNKLDFKTGPGVLYHLVRNSRSEALFADTNLLARTLILKGQPDAKTHRFEVTAKLHSLRDGKRYEVYYYCDICSIISSDPGPCMCCREPVRLLEKPEP